MVRNIVRSVTYIKQCILKLCYCLLWISVVNIYYASFKSSLSPFTHLQTSNLSNNKVKGLKCLTVRKTASGFLRRDEWLFC